MSGPDDLAGQIAALRVENAELLSFAHAVAHDLQSPLAQIGQFADLCDQRLAGGEIEKARAYLERVRASAGRMSDLISGLLDYAQTTRDTGPLGTVDLGAVAGEVVDDFAGRLAASKGALSLGALPMVRARRPQMYQLFTNLVDNAVKYAGDAPPSISIGSSEEDGEWRIWVRDNGIGLDASEASWVFELFKRSPNASGKPGRGIGLAVCRKVVESHGGRLWVESKPGAGATFYFTLPR